MARSIVDQNQKPDWTPFREFTRLFRKFPRLFGNFRVCFWRDCVQKMECPNSPINTAAKQCHWLLKAFNTTQPIPGECKPQCPITRFCGGIYHGVVTLAEIMILSHKVLFVPLLHDGPNGQTSKQCPAYSKYEDVQKTSLMLNIYQKMYLFEKTLFSNRNKYINYAYLWLPRYHQNVLLCSGTRFVT